MRIESGDAVFVRTGRWRRIAEKGPVNRQMPGLYAFRVKWLKQRDIALFGRDGVQDVRPTRVEGVDQPVHLLFLVAMGNASIRQLRSRGFESGGGSAAALDVLLAVYRLAVGFEAKPALLTVTTA